MRHLPIEGCWNTGNRSYRNESSNNPWCALTTGCWRPTWGRHGNRHPKLLNTLGRTKHLGDEAARSNQQLKDGRLAPSHLEEDKSGMDESWRSGSGRSGSGRPTGRMDSQRQRQVRSNRRATLLQSSPERIAGRRTQVVVTGHSHADFGRVHLSHTHTHRQRETRDSPSSITSHPKRRKKRWVWISHDAGFLETKQ